MARKGAVLLRNWYGLAATLIIPAVPEKYKTSTAYALLAFFVTVLAAEKTCERLLDRVTLETLRALDHNAKQEIIRCPDRILYFLGSKFDPHSLARLTKKMNRQGEQARRDQIAPYRG